MRDLEFWLDGVAASSVGIRLQKEIEFDAAEPDSESVHILGRSGDHVYEYGSYKNVRGHAVCYALGDDVAGRVGRISAFFRSHSGYRRLETAEDPEAFRLARIVNAPRLEPRMGLLAPFEIELDCKPQRWLKSGLYAVATASGSALYNHTGFAARPLIAVSGSGAGTVTVGSVTVTLSECDGVLIDCEAREVTRNGTSANSLMSGDWPTLEPGTSAIAFTGGVTAVSITPRWWTL